MGAGEDAIARLRAAKADRQLTKAIEAIKPGPLQALYIDGHNPLMLLYDAVSDGLHGQTDAENLVTARTIRLLLAELAKRIEQVLADHAEVTGAVTKLLQAKAARQDGKAQAGGAPSAGKVE